jgi:microcystin degradation protein MlrC
MSLVDCRMIGSFPTTIEPMRGFVDKISALEGKDGVLSISLAHCFPYADVPEMGARVLVITDNQRAAGDTLARTLADEFFGMRGKTQPDFQTPDGAASPTWRWRRYGIRWRCTCVSWLASAVNYACASAARPRPRRASRSTH